MCIFLISLRGDNLNNVQFFVFCICTIFSPFYMSSPQNVIFFTGWEIKIFRKKMIILVMLLNTSNCTVFPKKIQNSEQWVKKFKKWVLQFYGETRGLQNHSCFLLASILYTNEHNWNNTIFPTSGNLYPSFNTAYIDILISQ